MTFEIDLIQKVYRNFSNNVLKARRITNHPLTSTEKILYAHLGGAPAINGYSYTYRNG